MKSEEELISTFKASLNWNKKFLDSMSKHWSLYYKDSNKFLSKENLENFRKEQILSKGMDDAKNLENEYKLQELASGFSHSFVKEAFPDQNIGNANSSIKYSGKYFDYGIVHHLKWYEKIRRYIESKKIFLEIGAGFGSLARIILRNTPEIKYFIIDLPHANLLSTYYLQKNLPEKKIFDFSDFQTKSLMENIDKFDIFILPPGTIENNDIKFDFIINSRSFSEMNKININKYFNLINNKTNNKGYFLNVNRIVKDTVGEKIRIDEFPYDKNWKTIIFEEAPLQSNLLFILTQRIEDNKGDIHTKLNRIPNERYELKIYRHNLFTKFLKKYSYKFLNKILLLFFGKKLLYKIGFFLKKYRVGIILMNMSKK
tara:strand:- start:17834 stop:18946 length:1113 start_codon:yes stop_codon:yes gene_type:complete